MMITTGPHEAIVVEQVGTYILTREGRFFQKKGPARFVEVFLTKRK